MKEKKNRAMGMAEQAMRRCERTLRRGAGFQEAAWQQYRTLINPIACALEAQERSDAVSAMIDKLMPMSQKTIDEVWGFMGRSARRSADLMQKASEAADAQQMEENQALWVDFLKSSWGAAGSNIDAIMSLNGQAIDMWMDLLQPKPPALFPGTEMVAKPSRVKLPLPVFAKKGVKRRKGKPKVHVCPAKTWV